MSTGSLISDQIKVSVTMSLSTNDLSPLHWYSCYSPPLVPWLLRSLPLIGAQGKGRPRGWLPPPSVGPRLPSAGKGTFGIVVHKLRVSSSVDGRMHMTPFQGTAEKKKKNPNTAALFVLPAPLLPTRKDPSSQGQFDQRIVIHSLHIRQPWLL